MRASLAAQPDVATHAPQAFHLGEGELRLAREAEARGDALAADLHGDRSLAAFAQAVVIARVGRATEAEAEARTALARAEEHASRYGEQRRAMDREVDDLDKELKVAREAQLPAESGLASPDRERARLVAARSLVMQARLLCGAARLVSAEAPGLREAEATVADLERQADATPDAKRAAGLVDSTARVRAACLGTLTKARRAKAAQADATDALLAELSQSLAAPSAAGQASPGSKGNQGNQASREPAATSRDERGVVVSLAKPWRGDELTERASAVLTDLGKAAAAHPGVAIQIVLHDADPKAAGDALGAKRRLAAAKRALTSGGAPEARSATEHAGTRAPLVDPSDARRRDQNARLEVVFVLP
jgi:hypothetical protein